MTYLYDYLFPAMWNIYTVYWWSKSTNVKTTEREEPLASRLVRMAAIICAFALLWFPASLFLAQQEISA